MKKSIRKKFTKVRIEETNQSATLVTDQRIYKNKDKAFTKVYKDDGNYEIVMRLGPAATKIYNHIIYKLQPFKESIPLHQSLFNFSRPTYYKAIAELIEWDIITKGNGNNFYRINTEFIFNGKI